MKFARIALGLAIFGSPALAQDAQVKGCRILNAGIYASEPGTSVTRDPNGVLIHAGAPPPKLALSTTRVPMKTGVHFGFEYVIDGAPDGATVTIRDLLRYPEPGGRPPGSTAPLPVAPSDDHASINRSFFSLYTLEEPWELLPGKWRFELWSGNRELCSQEFTLVAP